MVITSRRERRLRKVRKRLSMDAMLALVQSAFAEIPDHRNSRATIPLADVLMSALAMFSLKDSSLLAFQNRRSDENMKNLFLIGTVPSDSAMRESQRLLGRPACVR